MSTKWLGPYVARITAVGEIDASNADAFGHYVLRHGANSRRLIVDLTRIEFFSVAGFFALCGIAERCAVASVNLMIVAGVAVLRVIQLCDDNHVLPVARS